MAITALGRLSGKTVPVPPVIPASDRSRGCPGALGKPNPELKIMTTTPQVRVERDPFPPRRERPRRRPGIRLASGRSAMASDGRQTDVIESPMPHDDPDRLPGRGRWALAY
jgi:hypothetical protein